MRNFDLTPYINLLPGYGELRVQENRTRNIVITNGKIITNEIDSKKGLSVRVLSGTTMGFAATEIVSDFAVKKGITQAIRNAGYLKPYDQQKKFQFKPFTHSMDLSTKKKVLTTAEIISFLMAIDGYLAKTYPDLVL